MRARGIIAVYIRDVRSRVLTILTKIIRPRCFGRLTRHLIDVTRNIADRKVISQDETLRRQFC